MALSLGEQLTLRALTGRVVAEALARGFGIGGTLGIVSNKTHICSGLASALGAAYVAAYGGGRRVVSAVMATPDEAETAVQALREADVIFLAFGGEAGIEENAALAQAFLQAAARANVDAGFVVHVRMIGPKLVDKAIAQAPELEGYLAGKPLYAFTFDLDRAVFIFHRANVAGGALQLERAFEVPLGQEHNELLRRSL